MAESKNKACARPEPEHAQDQTSESLLRSEIDFWQEMIEARCEDLPDHAVERMHFALALAKKRLAEWTGAPRDEREARVVPIRPARSA